MQHLADRGINCPAAGQARDGVALRTLPAARP
jgi:Ser/Thr protein kinase RdoA (MazF antagonist)